MWESSLSARRYCYMRYLLEPATALDHILRTYHGSFSQRPERASLATLPLLPPPLNSASGLYSHPSGSSNAT